MTTQGQDALRKARVFPFRGRCDGCDEEKEIVRVVPCIVEFEDTVALGGRYIDSIRRTTAFYCSHCLALAICDPQLKVEVIN